jgi:hypothetical protein
VSWTHGGRENRNLENFGKSLKFCRAMSLEGSRYLQGKGLGFFREEASACLWPTGVWKAEAMGFPKPQSFSG